MDQECHKRWERAATICPKPIGGISMLSGLGALDADPATKVILLVSKPPAPEVASRVLAAAEASAKPVVVIFLGADRRIHHPQRRIRRE